MTVYFIGAGPGAADLITVRGLRLVQRASRCLFAGSILPENQVRQWCSPGCNLINTAHLSLEAILEHLKQGENEDNVIARLHSGDVSFYSAVWEQTQRLDQLGIPWEIVPGVPAFAACAASARVTLTRPYGAQSVVVTRYGQVATPVPEGESIARFAATGATVALHLSMRYLDSVVPVLIEHYGEQCPCIVVSRASHEDEVVLRATLASVRSEVRDRTLPTAMMLVGPALGSDRNANDEIGVSSASNREDSLDSPEVRSHLYSAGRARTSTD